MPALLAFIKVILMIIGGLAMFGLVLMLLLALLTARRTPRRARLTEPFDFDRFVERRRFTFGPISEEEDDLVYAIGCAQVLGDDEAVHRLTTLFTNSIPRKNT